MKAYNWVPNRPDTLEWRARHLSGLQAPGGFEGAFAQMLRGWCVYAEIHQIRYGSPIGDDGVLGPEWAAIGNALRGLLNGELGRLDAGTLDSIIHDNLAEMGFGEGE